LIFIIGTNDLAHDIKPEFISDNVEQMINKTREMVQGINIILLAVLPVNEMMKDITSRLVVGIRKNSAINTLNDLLKMMAEKTNTVFIDITRQLSTEDGQLNLDYTFDGLHPNAEGYKIITRSILPFLQ
jgi:lysophospholipase L1-like esterase